jgi:hypothetical protein
MVEMLWYLYLFGRVAVFNSSKIGPSMVPTCWTYLPCSPASFPVIGKGGSSHLHPDQTHSVPGVVTVCPHTRSLSAALAGMVGDKVNCSWVLYSPEDNKSTSESEPLSRPRCYLNIIWSCGVEQQCKYPLSRSCCRVSMASGYLLVRFWGCGRHSARGLHRLHRQH